MDEARPWHRWFGLAWMAFFHGTGVTVEAEKDLAIQQQFLDVLILRRGTGPIGREMPDGMEDLAEHNLITFKSHHEPFDEWAAQELIYHYVAYRKLVSPSTTDLVPAPAFRLFAVCVRSPQGMAGRVPMDRVSDGVYDLPAVGLTIRVVVVRELPLERQNALLALFGGTDGTLRYGCANFRFPATGTGSLLQQIFTRYQQEGVVMPTTWERFVEESTTQLLNELPVERRLEGIPPQEVLKVVPLAEQLKGLTPEQILAALPPDVREALRQAPPPA